MRANRGGFTIIEVMIVLAITGAMFVMAVIMINGQQRKTQFAQSVRNFDSKVKDVLNDVSTGYYANAQNIGCSRSNAGPVVAVTAGDQTGKNKDCVFVGKAMHFYSEGFLIYTLLGNRLTGAGIPATAYSQALPIIIDSTVSPNVTAVNLTEDYKAAWGVRVYQIIDGTAAPSALVGVLGSLGSGGSGSYNTGAANFNSGVQRVLSYEIGTVPFVVGAPANKSQANTAVIGGGPTELHGASGLVFPANGYTICLEDGAAGDPARQVASVIIGGQGNTGTTTLAYDTGLCT